MKNEIINRTKLRGLMAENNLSQIVLANRLGCTSSTFNLKINRKREFTEREIAILYDLFHTLDLFNFDKE